MAAANGGVTDGYEQAAGGAHNCWNTVDQVVLHGTSYELQSYGKWGALGKLVRDLKDPKAFYHRIVKSEDGKNWTEIAGEDDFEKLRTYWKSKYVAVVQDQRKREEAKHALDLEKQQRQNEIAAIEHAVKLKQLKDDAAAAEAMKVAEEKDKKTAEVNAAAVKLWEDVAIKREKLLKSGADEPYNILLIGVTRAGKSSFLNSVAHAVQCTHEPKTWTYAERVAVANHNAKGGTTLQYKHVPNHFNRVGMAFQLSDFPGVQMPGDVEKYKPQLMAHLTSNAPDMKVHGVIQCIPLNAKKSEKDFAMALWNCFDATFRTDKCVTVITKVDTVAEGKERDEAIKLLTSELHLTNDSFAVTNVAREKVHAGQDKVNDPVLCEQLLQPIFALVVKLRA